MVTHVRQTRVSQQYGAWEGLIRAACASAAAQSPKVIRAISVSHRTNELSDEELKAVTGLAEGLAHDMHLAVETELAPGRLVLRFSRIPATDAEPSAQIEPFSAELKALWRRLVWQRRE